MTRLDDPALVAWEYADESALEARRAAYRDAEGPNAVELVFAAVAEAPHERVLEVGPGPGELAERISRELDAHVVAVDVSERMVALSRARGVDARLGDVQALPFDDHSFDCAVAAWVLFHAADVNRAISELARVLRPGGRLVAATNGCDHFRELNDLLGVDPQPLTFDAENGAELLRRHFARVERRDAAAWVVFPDRAAAQGYVDASIRLRGAARPLPEFDGPLRVRAVPAVFVAEAPR